MAICLSLLSLILWSYLTSNQTSFSRRSPLLQHGNDEKETGSMLMILVNIEPVICSISSVSIFLSIHCLPISWCRSTMVIWMPPISWCRSTIVIWMLLLNSSVPWWLSSQLSPYRSTIVTIQTNHCNMNVITQQQCPMVVIIPIITMWHLSQQQYPMVVINPIITMWHLSQCI